MLTAFDWLVLWAMLKWAAIWTVLVVVVALGAGWLATQLLEDLDDAER